MASVTFYFDLGSPYAYLTAERIGHVIAEPVVWCPVSLGALFKHTGRSSWALGDAGRRELGMAEVERRALGYGLPPVRWPDPWPTHYLMAMRAATYAFRVGRGREFVLRAFRDAFEGGRDLAVSEHVLDAAESVGLDRTAVRAATEDPDIKRALRQATEEAHARGVIGVPTLVIEGDAFWGDDRLEDGAARLGSPTAPR